MWYTSRWRSFFGAPLGRASASHTAGEGALAPCVFLYVALRMRHSLVGMRNLLSHLGRIQSPRMNFGYQKERKQKGQRPHPASRNGLGRHRDRDHFNIKPALLSHYQEQAIYTHLLPNLKTQKLIATACPTERPSTLEQSMQPHHLILRAQVQIQ